MRSSFTTQVGVAFGNCGCRRALGINASSPYCSASRAIRRTEFATRRTSDTSRPRSRSASRVPPVEWQLECPVAYRIARAPRRPLLEPLARKLSRSDLRAWSANARDVPERLCRTLRATRRFSWTSARCGGRAPARVATHKQIRHYRCARRAVLLMLLSSSPAAVRPEIGSSGIAPNGSLVDVDRSITESSPPNSLGTYASAAQGEVKSIFVDDDGDGAGREQLSAELGDALPSAGGDLRRCVRYCCGLYAWFVVSLDASMSATRSRDTPWATGHSHLFRQSHPARRSHLPHRRHPGGPGRRRPGGPG